MSTIKKCNSLGARDLSLLQSGRVVPGCKNTPTLLEQHVAVTGGVPYFRFPPEPNGFLHIGHAKAMNISFGNAKYYQGKAYLRFDDTNPETESMTCINNIKDIVHWMGWNPDWVTYTSDYFDKLYEFAIVLINKGLAYVDHSTVEMLRTQREEGGK